MSADATPTNEKLDAPPLVLAPGVVLCDRFRLDRIIASGGYGDVWTAFDLDADENRIAIKILRNDAGNHDPSALARMRVEADILQRIRHPNIVQVFGFFESPYGHFLAMELLDGLAIDQMLQADGPAPHDKVLVNTRQILSALQAAHTQDVLHRDIKPENILLTKTPGGLEAAKLLDFGIAKARNVRDNDDGVTLVQTRAGGFMGTPRYAAPEQAVGDPLSPASDIFALGLVIAEWLTDKVRLDGDRHADVMQKLLDNSPIDVSDCPPRWQAWLKRCLTKNPAQRFQSAEEAMHALDDMVVNYVPAPEFVKNESYFSPPMPHPSFGPTPAPVSVFSTLSGPIELDLDRIQTQQKPAPKTPMPVIPGIMPPAYQHTPPRNFQSPLQPVPPRPQQSTPPRPIPTQPPRQKLTWVDYAWAWAIFMFIAVLSIITLGWFLQTV